MVHGSKIGEYPVGGRMKRIEIVGIWLLALVLVSGCASIFGDSGVDFEKVEEWFESIGDSGGVATNKPPVVVTNAPPDLLLPSDFPSEIDGPVTFLHHDVSRWPVTAKMTASVSKGQIVCNYDKARVWPELNGVNANPWVIAKFNGKWYAATYEWYRFGQTSKPVGVLDGSKGDHIKVSPLNKWRPKSGERIGLMVSGLARSAARNAQERSPVVMVTWP